MNPSGMPGRCLFCGKTGEEISSELEVCADCIRSSSEAFDTAMKAHRPIPHTPGGKVCTRCVNACRIGPGETGFCGVRWNLEGEIVDLFGEEALVTSYLDPLPTNCVAGWICPECRMPPSISREFNLAVFYGACSFDCLFCQNWHYRDLLRSMAPRADPASLATRAGSHTPCLCFFGGDPVPFIEHSISTAELVRRRHAEMRICWETNGSVSADYVKEIGEIALNSGGIIKVDLKAIDNRIHRALCGTSNSATLRTVQLLADMSAERREPLLVVSTLMVPGYVDVEEVRKIAEFISGLDEGIPYSLLAFHPAYKMADMPMTSRAQAEHSMTAALETGLRKVHIGNEWLLV